MLIVFIDNYKTYSSVSSISKQFLLYDFGDTPLIEVNGVETSNNIVVYVEPEKFFEISKNFSKVYIVYSSVYENLYLYGEYNNTIYRTVIFIGKYKNNVVNSKTFWLSSYGFVNKNVSYRIDEGKLYAIVNVNVNKILFYLLEISIIVSIILNMVVVLDNSDESLNVRETFVLLIIFLLVYLFAPPVYIIISVLFAIFVIGITILDK